MVRIIGVTDDTTNVRLTLQALNRGKIIKKSNKLKKNESLIQIDTSKSIPNNFKSYKNVSSQVKELFKSIDEFTLNYRQALTSNKNKGSDSSSNSSSSNSSSSSKNSGNLLTLNPLANALYLQLAGSKDFIKAYNSLQKLYGNMNNSSSDKFDNNTFLRVIDLTSAIIPFPNHEKLHYLNQFDLNDRLTVINNMVSGMIEVLKNLSSNSSYINHWFYNEATNLQKANVVANQLKSIRLVLENMTNKDQKNQNKNNSNAKSLIRRKKGLDNDENYDDVDDDMNGDDDDDDELKQITDFIKNKLPHITGLSSDSKRLIVKDYKRIKSSPPGNSDFHVIRNYLDVVCDLPWDKFVSKFQNDKDINIEEARKQLDLDHYGLDNVKNRLIQYLVVLKLLGINATNEVDKRLSEDEKKRTDKTIGSSNNDQQIMIENSDETSSAHKAARNKNQTSKTLTDQKVSDQKNLMVSKTNKSPIIMLAGPPGIGKTSLAKSIATSLGRNFQRISLGGIKDESEIRGHRRTYVGAMSGVIVQALRKSRSMNPVILLDEIDKVVGGNNSVNKFNGDPSAALLEVLDPEQNSSFSDHYLGFPIDLSQVIFICTANEPYNLSKPLMDRLEMIELNAYDYHEKLIIGRKYLLPRQIKRNGLPDGNLINITDDIMKKIINNYTREAGVRNLERKLGTICRFKAVEYSQHLNDLQHYNSKIEEFDLPKYLGIPFPNLSMEIYDAPSQFGIVNGLSYNGEGSGSVLTFESIGFNNPDKGGSLNMTGRLGEVLMESAKIGLTYIKLILYKNVLNFNQSEMESLIEKFKNLEIHLHVPMGSIQKDGPSAGITMALLFVSLMLEKPIDKDIAMTGEITLRGMVLPIGGIKEKILGAHLSGIKRIIVPRENRKDLIEEYVKAINDNSQLNPLLMDNEHRYDFTLHDPENYFHSKYGIKIYYANQFWDVLKIVWGEDLIREPTKLIEYHI